MIKPHQKPIVFPCLLRGWLVPPAQSRCSAVGSEVMRSRTRGGWRGRKMSSYILRQATSWVQFSITAAEFLCDCVCTVHLCLCLSVLCHCVKHTCVSVCVCAFPVLEAKGFLPIRTWRREQMELSEVYSQLSPLLKPCYQTPTHSPLPPLYPPQPAVHSLCNLIKATGLYFMV